MSKRTTLYLDDQLLDRARRFVPERGISAFVNQVLAERLAALEREELEAEMAEGYLAGNKDHEELNADWQVVEVELWPK
jgi:hypothetical protein